MEFATMFALVVTSIAIAVYWFESYSARSKIKGIPEPPRTLVFGHALKFMTSCLEKTMLDWKLAYGEAVQCHLLHIRLLILGSKSAIHDCFTLPQASGRPRVGLLQSIFEKFGEGPVIGEGPEYDEQRQFFTRALPVHGESRRKLEASFRTELVELLTEWQERCKQVVDLNGITGTYVINSFWKVLGSTKYTKAELRQMTLALERMVAYTTLKEKLQLLFHRILRKIGIGSSKQVDCNAETILKIILDLIAEHEKNRAPGNPRDMIDLMLEKRDKTTDPKSAFHANNAPQAFRLAEIWVASLETTTRTIEYLILLMSQNPDAVARVRQEILDVLGPDQEPETSHWELMPFSAACVTEVVRMFPAAVSGLAHKALEDFEFRGALIPRGTLIVANIWGVNHDPQVWVRPNEFNPSRFLNSEGQLDASMRSKVVSFSLGRRQCPGRQMGLDAIFFFLVTAFRQFDFESVGPVDFGYKYEGTSIAPKDGNRFKIVPLMTTTFSTSNTKCVLQTGDSKNRFF